MMHRYRDRDWEDRGPWRAREDVDYARGRDFGWRGTELDRGFPRHDSGYDPRFDRGYAPRHFDDRDRYDERDRYAAENNRHGNESVRYRDERDRYLAERDRYRDDERYRYQSGDPYFDRGYERPRDDARDLRYRDRDSGPDFERDRGRDYWDDYPWSRYRR